MWQYAAKIAVTALVVVGITEISRRSTLWAAALASLPLTSVLAFVWLYLESHDTARIATLSHGIFWLVLPSLVLFLTLPFLLRLGWTFWPSLLVACAATSVAYGGMVWLLGKAGLQT